MADPYLLDPVKIIITVIVAFLPAIIYTILIRYSEKYEREPWGSIGQAFLWGGTLCIVAVILIRGYIRLYFQDHYPDIASDDQYISLIMLCMITPVVAEILKLMGLLFVRSDILEAEDGLIYGAVIGLGYTATENLLYGIYLGPLYGVEMFITVVFMRSMSVMFIHSSTTAIACYGVTRAMKVKHKTGSFLLAPLFVLAAIGIHMTFNYIVFNNLFNVGEIDILFSISTGLLFSIIFAFVLMFTIYFKIYRLDRIDETVEKERIAKEEELDQARERAWRQEQQRPRRMAPPAREPDPYSYPPYPSQPSPPSRPQQQQQSQQFMHLYDRPREQYGYPQRPPMARGPPTPTRAPGTGARRAPGYGHTESTADYEARARVRSPQTRAPAQVQRKVQPTRPPRAKPAGVTPTPTPAPVPIPGPGTKPKQKTTRKAPGIITETPPPSKPKMKVVTIEPKPIPKKTKKEVRKTKKQQEEELVFEVDEGNADDDEYDVEFEEEEDNQKKDKKVDVDWD